MRLVKCSLQLKAFDFSILNKVYQEITNSTKDISKISFSGSVPLPIRIKKITVNRSPHIDKKSREQFEIRTYRRIIEIKSTCNTATGITLFVERLKKMVFFGTNIKVVFTYHDVILL